MCAAEPPYLAAFSTRLATTCSMRAASTTTSGRLGAIATSTCASRRRPRARSRPAPTSASAVTATRGCSSGAALSRRDMVSKSPIKSFKRSASRSISARNSWRVASSHSISASRRELVKPLMWASGVRSSCDVAASNSSRTPSACRSSPTRTALSSATAHRSASCCANLRSAGP